MKKLKYFLFIFILLLSPAVLAVEFNMNPYTSATNGGTKNRYRATEIYNTGISNTYTFGTQYSGRISDIETYFNYPFSANMTYRLTYNMNSDDFRNNFGSSYWWYCDQEMTNINAHVQTVNYVSYKKVTFSFTPTETSTCIRVWLRSKNLSSTAITGVSNWRLNNITIYDPEWQNGSTSSSGSQGSSPGSSGTSSTNNNEEIINNATENTHTIVDNANQNTESIINNSNENTESIINNANENTNNITNSIDNVNQQLGVCYKNLLSFNDLFPENNTYIQGKTFKQTESDLPDSPSSGKSIKLQLYDSSNNLIDTFFNSNILSVARFNFYFTNTENVHRVVFGVNGSVRDTLVGFYTSDLNLDPNSVYTLSFNILSALQGNITFSNFSLVKGNFYSDTFIDYGKSYCTSKLDDINGAIAGAIAGAAQNAQDIINNQNSNTNKEIESQQVCKFYDISSTSFNNKFLTDTGSIGNSTSSNTTNFIPIDKFSKLYLINKTSVEAARLCFYNVNKSYISCLSSIDLELGLIPIPNDAQFVIFTINKNQNKPQYRICKNGNQSLNDSIDNLNDSINNSNVDNNTGTGFFNNFTSQDFGLSEIITIPLNTIQSLTSKTCVPLQVPIPFTNSNISLPCMTEIYETKFPSIYNLWKIVSFGIVAYLIAIDIFHIVKGFKDPESDKVEVLDL